MVIQGGIVDGVFYYIHANFTFQQNRSQRSSAKKKISYAVDDDEDGDNDDNDDEGFSPAQATVSSHRRQTATTSRQPKILPLGDDEDNDEEIHARKKSSKIKSKVASDDESEFDPDDE